MNEWMNEWVNEWMREWIHEWMDEWMNEWIDEWVNEWTDEWMNNWMNEWTDEWMNAWMNEWTNEWIRDAFGKKVSNGFPLHDMSWFELHFAALLRRLRVTLHKTSPAKPSISCARTNSAFNKNTFCASPSIPYKKLNLYVLWITINYIHSISFV
jgi:hypothetical protein